jgi:hypothetical protein
VERCLAVTHMWLFVQLQAFSVASDILHAPATKKDRPAAHMHKQGQTTVGAAYRTMLNPTCSMSGSTSGILAE